MNNAQGNMEKSNQQNISTTFLGKIEKYVFSFSDKITTGAGAILIAMMFLCFGDVFFRYILHRPLLGAMELIEFMLATIAALSFAYAEAQKSHFTIDFFTSKMPPKTYAIIETITDMLGITIIILATAMLFKYSLHIKEAGLVSANLELPTYVFVFILGLGWALFSITKIINIAKSVKEKGKQFWIGATIGVLLLLFCASLPALRQSTHLSRSSVGLIGTILILVFAFSGMSLGLGMMAVGFFGMMYVAGMKPALNLLSIVPYSTPASYSYSVYPLFMLMGVIIFVGGIGENIFKAVNKWLGHLSGGIAIATIVGCAFFAAISGSATAMVATMGKVVIPEFRKLKYNDKLATGSIAAGGTIGVLIPPSTVLILYGILTQQPIGKLFMAGFLPGILKAITYIIVTVVLCKKNPDWGPRAPEKPSFQEMVISVKYIWPIVFLFILVIGGMYAGIFTPTEAAGMGAFGAFFVAVIGRKFSPIKDLFESGVDVTRTMGRMFTVLIGANLFGYFLALTRVPFEISDYIAGLGVNRYLVILIVIIIYLILGSIMDIFSVFVISVPIMYPLVTSLGFDPIWFGILSTWLFEIGALTPPIGINVFVLKNIVRDIPLETIFAGVAPFYIADMIALALLVAFPQIATFLPSLMG